METPLITQSSLDEVGLRLDNLGTDFSAHADGPLSSAHGINAFHFTVPTLDAYGNDLQTYQDSAGNVVGEYMLRFLVGSTLYYAPARATALAAQAPVAQSQTEAATEETLNGRGSTALATQFRTTAIEDIEAVRDGVLLPHSRLGHWEAHSPVRAIPRVTLDSAGHTVGRYTLVWQFRGAKFEIPCDTRLGGPPQAPRAVAITPASINETFEEGEGYAEMAVIALTCTASGTRPFGFVWELKTAGEVWLPLTNEDGTSTGDRTSYDNRLKIAGSAVNTANQSVFSISSISTIVGGNSGQIRCVVSSSGGTASTIVPVYVKDKTQSGICSIFTSSCEVGYCEPRYLLDAVRFQIGAHKRYRVARQEWGGYKVLGPVIGRLIKRRRWYSNLLFRWIAVPLHRGMVHATEGTRIPLGLAVGLAAMRLVLLATYYLRRSEAERQMKILEHLSLMQLYKRKLRQLKKLAERR